MTSRGRIVAAGVVVVLAGPAFAGTKTYSGTGSWHTGGSWAPPGVPTEADRAVIPNGATCTIDGNTDAVADTIEIAGTGILNIAAGRRLTLDNDNDNFGGAGTDHSIVNGQVILLFSLGSGGSTLKFDENDHDVSGTGVIDCDNTASKIQIAAAKTLINNLATAGAGIRGSMTIEGLTGGTDGTFFNSGLLEAEDGTIVLASTTLLDDDDAAVWGLRCHSEMEFNRTATNLLGDFTNFATDSHGTFTFNQSVATCGTFTRNNGDLIIGSTRAFVYFSFAGATECGNPGTLDNVEQCGGNIQMYFVTATSTCAVCNN